MKLKLLAQLFASFIKIGMISFGGGIAVIPLLQREVVERRRWISNEELTDVMAIAQTMPGIIMVNSSTILGYRVCGLIGAATATIASILPTFIIVLVLTIFFWAYTDNPLIKKVFTGVLLGVTSLVVYSISKTWKSSIKNYFDVVVAVGSALLLIVFKINVAIVILGMAVLGFCVNLYKFKKIGGIRA